MGSRGRRLDRARARGRGGPGAGSRRRACGGLQGRRCGRRGAPAGRGERARRRGARRYRCSRTTPASTPGPARASTPTASSSSTRPLMEGSELRAGGVCALPPFLHPIAIARAVLEDGRHVLYAGEGAARFAREHGFAPVSSEVMTTPAARARWAAARAGLAGEGWAGGTVGAVARDAKGAVAAATSTGGLVNKRLGRVGDSPLPGAGTYADGDGRRLLGHRGGRGHHPRRAGEEHHRRAAGRRTPRGTRPALPSARSGLASGAPEASSSSTARAASASRATQPR